MKNIITYFSFLAIFSLCACNDYLDVEPKNHISLETTEDIQGIMSSYFYNASGIESLWGSNPSKLDGKNIYFPYNTAVTTNFMFYGDNIRMEEIPSVFYATYYLDEYYEAVEWKSFEFSNAFWSENYHNIGLFNIVLDALAEIEDKSSKIYLETYCETKILRTMIFFNILKFYAPYNNNEYGIPITISSEAIEGTGRSTQEESYKFILDELSSLQTLDFTPTEWNVFYSKEKLSALLAQIYWFKAESAAKENNDWTEAAKYANEVLTGKTLANSSLELKTIFEGGSSTGFESNNPHSLLIVRNNRNTKANFYAPWGWAASIPAATELANLYSATDIRRDAYFDDFMLIEKWVPAWGIANVVPLWRIAEFQLIAAEAYARMGDNDNALTYLNTFKQSRDLGFTTYSDSDILDEILRERRKEFCFEFGYRWLDLRRMNKGFTRVGIPNQTPRDPIDFVLKDGDYRFALPIPLILELGYNNNMDQNPGW